MDRGLGWVQRARQLEPDEGPTLYRVACAYALAGRAEEALDVLEETLATGFSGPDWIANDPDWEPLRGHPRFTALVHRR